MRGEARGESAHERYCLTRPWGPGLWRRAPAPWPMFMGKRRACPYREGGSESAPVSRSRDRPSRRGIRGYGAGRMGVPGATSQVTSLRYNYSLAIYQLSRELRICVVEARRSQHHGPACAGRPGLGSTAPHAECRS